MTALVLKHLPLVVGAPDGIKKLRELILALAVRGRLLPTARQSGSDVPVGWIQTKLGSILSFEYGDNLPAAKRSNTGEYPVYGSNGVVGTHNVSFVQQPCIVIGRKGSAGALNLCTSPGCCVTDVAYYCIPPQSLSLEYTFKLLHTLGLDNLGKGIKPGLNRNEAYALDVLIPTLDEQHRIVAKVDELMALCDRLEADQAGAEAAHAQLVQALLGSLTQTTDAADFRDSWQRLSEHFHTLFTTEASIDALKAAVLELGVTGRLIKGGQADCATSVIELVSSERRATLSPTKCKKHEELANAVYWDCPYDLPTNWTWVSLAALLMQITDGTHHTPTYVERGVPFISVKDLDGRTVSFDDCRQIPEAEHEAINSRCNPERGDLLLCRIGTLGRPTIVDTDRPFSLFVSVGLLKMPKQVDLSNFLHLVLSSPVGYRQYERIKAGGSHTNKLNLGDIPKIMIPVPPLEEQRSIIAKVDELMTLCDQLKAGVLESRQLHGQLAAALVEQAVA